MRAVTPDPLGMGAEGLRQGTWLNSWQILHGNVRAAYGFPSFPQGWGFTVFALRLRQSSEGPSSRSSETVATNVIFSLSSLFKLRGITCILCSELRKN